MCLHDTYSHGGIRVKLRGQVPNGDGRGYEVLADPHHLTGNLVLSASAEHFCLVSVELESVAPHSLGHPWWVQGQIAYMCI